MGDQRVVAGVPLELFEFGVLQQAHGFGEQFTEPAIGHAAYDAVGRDRSQQSGQ